MVRIRLLQRILALGILVAYTLAVIQLGLRSRWAQRLNQELPLLPIPAVTLSGDTVMILPDGIHWTLLLALPEPLYAQPRRVEGLLDSLRLLRVDTLPVLHVALLAPGIALPERYRADTLRQDTTLWVGYDRFRWMSRQLGVRNEPVLFYLDPSGVPRRVMILPR